MRPPVCLISEAAELAACRHSGMARKGRGNEPYINHLAEVANLLATAIDGVDAEPVAAGWLHDAIEDTDTTREELVEKFSERIASCRGGNPWLDTKFDDTVKAARALL